MTFVTATSRANGREAERQFHVWLLESKLALMMVDQTPLTMPTHMRGTVKRPDFLVGILSIGAVAVDVKARTLHNGMILIDPDEHAAFTAFEAYFGMPVWYACYLSQDYSRCLLFRNADIRPEDIVEFKQQQLYGFPAKYTTETRPEAETFDIALMRASRERLK